MRFRIKDRIPKGDDILTYKNETIIIDPYGVHFHDACGEKEDSIIDFFYGIDARIVMEHYLLLRSMRLGFKLYDLDKKEEKAVLVLDEDHLAGEYGYFVKDDKLFVLSGSYSNRLMDFIMLGEDKKDEEKDSRIDVYSLSDFSHTETIDLKGFIEKLFYVDFLDSMYGIDTEGHICQIKDGDLVRMEQIHFEVENLLVNSDRKEIYLQSATSVRIYDKNFREINKIDVVDSDYSSVSPMDELPISISMHMGSMERAMSQKNMIHHMDFYDENTFLFLKSMNLGAQFGIELVDIKTGKVLHDMPFGGPVESIRPFGNGMLLLKFMGDLILLEVEK